MTDPVKRGLVVGTVVVVLGLVSAAANALAGSLPASYWTTGQANAFLASPNAAITWVWDLGNAAVAKSEPQGDFGPVLIHAPRCHGLGVRHTAGYGAFTCRFDWVEASDVSHIVLEISVWMRPWSFSRACVSTRTLAECPPLPPVHPLPGDPRICTLGTAALGCMVNNAETATVRELKTQGRGPVASLGCLASTTFVYRCTWSPTGTATVSFAPGKSAWTTTVTLGP